MLIKVLNKVQKVLNNISEIFTATEAVNKDAVATEDFSQASANDLLNDSVKNGESNLSDIEILPQNNSTNILFQFMSFLHNNTYDKNILNTLVRENINDGLAGVYFLLKLAMKYVDLDNIDIEEFRTDINAMKNDKVSLSYIDLINICYICKQFDLATELTKEVPLDLIAENYTLAIYKTYFDPSADLLDAIERYSFKDEQKAHLHYLGAIKSEENIEQAGLHIDKAIRILPNNQKYHDLKQIIDRIKILEAACNKDETKDIESEANQFSSMTYAESHNYYQALKKCAQEEIAKNLPTLHIEGWKYNDDYTISKKDTTQLIDNHGLVYYAHIASKVRDKIGAEKMKSFDQALNKGSIGRHKQNAVVFVHNNLIKITSNLDDRIFTNKIFTWHQPDSSENKLFTI